LTRTKVYKIGTPAQVDDGQAFFAKLQPPSLEADWQGPAPAQLAARGTKERARLGWPFFCREKIILKTIMFRDVRTVLNERKHLKMVIRSVPDSVSLILSRTE
jgi:hypothetical protein